MCPAFPHALLGQADNPRRLVVHHDDSIVRSCAYPCTTLLGGIHWWIQCDRLSRPLHSVDSQSQPWGVCIILASRREELHLYSLQVIKDLVVFDPSSLASGPFRGNGSQRPLERGLQAYTQRDLCLLPRPQPRRGLRTESLGVAAHQEVFGNRACLRG